MVLSLKNLIVFYLFKHLQKFSLKSIQSLPQELQDYIFERFVFWKSLSDEHLKYFPYGKEILDLANCRLVYSFSNSKKFWKFLFF